MTYPAIVARCCGIVWDAGIGWISGVMGEELWMGLEVGLIGLRRLGAVMYLR